MTKTYRYETLQLHAGQEPAPGTRARAVPIDQARCCIDDIEDDFEQALITAAGLEARVA